MTGARLLLLSKVTVDRRHRRFRGHHKNARRLEAGRRICSFLSRAGEVVRRNRLATANHLVQDRSTFEKEDRMRIAHFCFAISMAALVSFAAPVLAKSSETRKTTDDEATTSSCHAYQQAEDGSWVERPCEEKSQPVQTQPKPVARGSGEEPR